MLNVNVVSRFFVSLVGFQFDLSSPMSLVVLAGISLELSWPIFGERIIQFQKLVVITVDIYHWLYYS